MAGAVANILDNNDSDFEVYPTKVKAKYWFNLLKRMEEMSDLDDPMDILGLVNEPKPLKALDLCYRDDPNTFSILTDGLASCVTVCAYAPDSRRSYQMLLVMQAIIPYFIDACEKDTVDQMNSAASVKHEVNIYTTLCVEMKALVNSCEILARGPTRTFDIVNTVTERGKSFIADSPQFFDPPTIIEEDVKLQYSSSNKDKKNPSGWEGVDNSEVQREVFRRPRDALLVLSATFIEKGAPRLKELSKLAASLEHTKLPELFDHKCHVKLSEMALALLKVAPYDSNTLGCLGLQKYFVSILPITDWSVEGNRSALNIILRRLDKTIQKIGKRLSLRRRTNWNALSSWLNGLYSTLMAYPYIAHLHPLKTITQMCLRIMVGDPCSEDGSSQSASHSITLSTILHSSTPPASFCNAVLRLASFLMQALGQFCFSLELMCSAEGIGPTAERLEAVLCHILIPVCLRCATAQKDTSHFQQRDIAFCLQLMHNAINPPLTKQCLGPAGSGNLAASIMRGSTSHVADISGRQSSVSVTDRGHSATVSTHRIVRETVCQAIFLALKVMMVVFHKQMTSHWSRIARIVRDLYGKKVGGASLFSFIDFILDSNLPISLVILPILQTKMNQKPSSEYEAVWQTEFKARIEKHGRYSRGGIKSIHTILNELSLELQTLKDDFATRPMEVARSHTPTMTELHSDSGSIHSVSAPRLSASKSIGEPRRLSSQALNRLSRLTPNFYKGTNNEATLEGTIIEDTEDESSQSKQTRVMKISSLPTTRSTCHSFSGRIGMWRSMRRKSRACSADSESGPSRPRSSVEMGEIPPIGHHRRTRSCSRRFPLVEDSVAIALNVEQPLAAAHLIVPNESDERLKTVSFSTPKRVRNEMSVGHFDRLSQRLNIDDSTDRITARHHYV
ncbi:hypothetical protein AB6A40_006324 [Gnathostoma spinigerum]|uniref:Protein UNC80 C-terminal domain-containing protein n=1 Tax=Gnathostoma spinigerum TaxID=75299 RepID=A0ABD6EJ86_9BILA